VSDDRGAVTVEAALALCALTVFLVLALGALVAVAQTMRCADAARELARLAARGEPDRGRAVAGRLAPYGARMELVTDGDTVTALVSVRLVGPLPLTVDGRAVAALEGVGSP
jgi:Flp pilus assembly protein TadG